MASPAHRSPTLRAAEWSYVVTNRVKRVGAALVVLLVSFAQVGSASGGTFEDFDPTLTYGSVEAIPNPAVVDTQPLRNQSLAVREALVGRILACGYVDRVLDALTETGAIGTIDDDNSSFAVGAGGFDELAQLRAAHLRFIDHAQRVIPRRGGHADSPAGLLKSVSHLPCRL